MSERALFVEQKLKIHPMKRTKGTNISMISKLKYCYKYQELLGYAAEFNIFVCLFYFLNIFINETEEIT